jgi:hypothetical protein
MLISTGNLPKELENIGKKKKKPKFPKVPKTKKKPKKD